ncbi:MAG: PBECR2 nuclease fold domain-containing protein [Kiritimatiellales bacterium]
MGKLPEGFVPIELPEGFEPITPDQHVSFGSAMPRDPLKQIYDYTKSGKYIPEKERTALVRSVISAWGFDTDGVDFDAPPTLVEREPNRNPSSYTGLMGGMSVPRLVRSTDDLIKQALGKPMSIEEAEKEILGRLGRIYDDTELQRALRMPVDKLTDIAVEKEDSKRKKENAKLYSGLYAGVNAGLPPGVTVPVPAHMMERYKKESKKPVDRDNPTETTAAVETELNERFGRSPADMIQEAQRVLTRKEQEIWLAVLSGARGEGEQGVSDVVNAYRDELLAMSPDAYSWGLSMALAMVPESDAGFVRRILPSATAQMSRRWENTFRSMRNLGSDLFDISTMAARIGRELESRFPIEKLLDENGGVRPEVAEDAVAAVVKLMRRKEAPRGASGQDYAARKRQTERMEKDARELLENFSETLLPAYQQARLDRIKYGAAAVAAPQYKRLNWLAETTLEGIGTTVDMVSLAMLAQIPVVGVPLMMASTYGSFQAELEQRLVYDHKMNLSDARLISAIAAVPYAISEQSEIFTFGKAPNLARYIGKKSAPKEFLYAFGNYYRRAVWPELREEYIQAGIEFAAMETARLFFESEGIEFTDNLRDAVIDARQATAIMPFVTAAGGFSSSMAQAAREGTLRAFVPMEFRDAIHSIKSPAGVYESVQKARRALNAMDEQGLRTDQYPDSIVQQVRLMDMLGMVPDSGSVRFSSQQNDDGTFSGRWHATAMGADGKLQIVEGSAGENFSTSQEAVSGAEALFKTINPELYAKAQETSNTSPEAIENSLKEYLQQQGYEDPGGALDGIRNQMQYVDAIMARQQLAIEGYKQQLEHELAQEDETDVFIGPKFGLVQGDMDAYGSALGLKTVYVETQQEAIDQFPELAKQAKGEKIKAVNLDGRTIVLVGENLENAQDAREQWWHEAAGHRGLDLNPKAQRFLDSVKKELGMDFIKSQVPEFYHNQTDSEIVAEYLSRLVGLAGKSNSLGDTQQEKKVWERFKEWINTEFGLDLPETIAARNVARVAQDILQFAHGFDVRYPDGTTVKLERKTFIRREGQWVNEKGKAVKDKGLVETIQNAADEQIRKQEEKEAREWRKKNEARIKQLMDGDPIIRMVMENGGIAMPELKPGESYPDEYAAIPKRFRGKKGKGLALDEMADEVAALSRQEADYSTSELRAYLEAFEDSVQGREQGRESAKEQAELEQQLLDQVQRGEITPEQYERAMTELVDPRFSIGGDRFVDALHDIAAPAPEVEFSREEWGRLFPDGRVDTPVGQVKLGEHQFEKLKAKRRSWQLGMMHSTLTDPAVVIEQPSGSWAFLKAFIDGDKKRRFLSVAISKDGERIVITNHMKKEKQVEVIMQNGRLVFQTTALSERLGSPRNQPANENKTPSAGESQPRFSVAPPVDTLEFKRWFGDSKVVDASGKPLVVYHGTHADFNEFLKQENKNGTRLGEGFYFTADRRLAERYAGKSGRVLEVYLKAERPFRISEMAGAERETALSHEGHYTELGYDSYFDPDMHIIVVHDSTQVKSATDNTGTFDPGNPDIRFSVSGDTELPITALSGEKINIKQAYEIYKKIQNAGDILNEDGGFYLRFTGSGRQKTVNTLSTSGIPGALSLIEALPEIARTAVAVYSHDDARGASEIERINRLFAPVMLNGEVYRAKLTVKKITDYDKSGDVRKLYDVALDGIDKADVKLITHADNSLDDSPSASTIKLDDMMAGYKDNQRRFSYPDNFSPGARFSIEQRNDPYQSAAVYIAGQIYNGAFNVKQGKGKQRGQWFPKTDAEKAAEVRNILKSMGAGMNDAAVNEVLSMATAAAAATLRQKNSFKNNAQVSRFIRDEMARQWFNRQVEEVYRAGREGGRIAAMAAAEVRYEQEKAAQMLLTSRVGMNAEKLLEYNLDPRRLLEKLDLEVAERKPPAELLKRKPLSDAEFEKAVESGTPIVRDLNGETEQIYKVRVDDFMFRLRSAVVMELQKEGVIGPVRFSSLAMCSPVAVAEFRQTLKTILGQMAADLTYGFRRDVIERRINSLDNVKLGSALERRASIILQQMLNAQDYETLQGQIDHVLEVTKQFSGHLKYRQQEISRAVNARATKMFRHIRGTTDHAGVLFMSPAAVETEMQMLHDRINNPNTLRAAFPEGTDLDDALQDTIDRYNMLERFGAFKYKKPAERADAVNWLNERLESELKAQEERREKVKAEAGKIQAALIKTLPRRKTEGYNKRSPKEWWADGNSQVYMIEHRLLELVNYGKGADRKAAQELMQKISFDIASANFQKNNSTANDNLAFGEALRRIYGVRFAENEVRALMTPSEEFQRFSLYGQKLSRAQILQMLGMLAQQDIRSRAEAIAEIGDVLKAMHGGDVVKYIKRHGIEAVAESLYQDADEFIKYRLKNGMELSGYQVYQAVRAVQEGSFLAQRLAMESEMIAALRKVSPKDFELLNWFRDYYRQNRPELSEVNKQITGFVIQPPDPLYIPAKVDYMAPPMSSLHVTMPVVPPSLTPRVFSTRDLDESADIVSIYMRRLESNQHFIKFAGIHQQVARIFNDQKLMKAIELTHGARFAEQLITHLRDTISGQPVTSGRMEAIDSLVNFFSVTRLGWNLSLFPKQVTSIPSFAMYVPGWDFMRHIATAFTPEGIATMREIMNSEHAKTRRREGFTQVDREILSGLNEKGMTFWEGYKRFGRFPTEYGDIMPTLIFGQGYYRAMLNDAAQQGMKGEEAKSWAMDQLWRLVEMSQQSGSIMNMPEWQRHGGSFGRALGQLLSTPSQFWAKQVFDWRAWRAALEVEGFGSDRESAARAQFLKTSFINHVLLAGLYNAVSIAWRGMLGEPPDEKDFIQLVESILVGPWSGILVIGAIQEGMAHGLLTGESGFGGGEMIPIAGLAADAQTIGAAVNAALYGDWGEVWKELEKIMKGAVPPYRDVKKAYENYLE